MHWSTLGEWMFFSERLNRIRLPGYISDVLLAFIGVMLFSTVYLLFGSLFIKALLVQKKEVFGVTLSGWLAFWGTAFLLGQGAFSLIFLSLASMDQLTPAHTAVILVIGAVAGIINIKHVVSWPSGIFRPTLDEFKKNKFGVLMLLFVISIMFISLFYSSTRQSYDATAIYFSNAKLSALTNRAEYFTDDTFVASVLHSTIQYTAIIQIFGDQSARMLSWSCGLVMLFFTLSLGEKVGLSRMARLVLVIFLISSTAFLDLLGDGKVDLVSSAPALAAVYWLVAGGQSNEIDKSTLILVGCLSGLAIVGRPFNLFLLGIFIFVYYLRKLFSQRRYKVVVNSLVWISIGAVGFGIYHLMANWMILGHPLAFLSSVSSINSSSGPWDSSPERILFYRLMYPVAATFVNTPQSLGNITPLFVTFQPFIMIASIRKRISLSQELKSLLIISTITLLLWISLFFTILELRYVMFLWVILFMPAAEFAAMALEDTDRLIRIISRGLIVVLLAFILIRTFYISVDTYSPIDKQGNPQCDKSRFCEYLQSINAVASPGDRVLTLSAFRYYLRTDLFSCSTGHEEYQMLRTASSTSDLAFWEEVHRQGYEYIAYENDYTTRHLQFHLIPDLANTPDWIELEPIFGKPGDLEIAYKITVTNPPNKVEAKCEKNSFGVWEVNYPFRHETPDR